MGSGQDFGARELGEDAGADLGSGTGGDLGAGDLGAGAVGARARARDEQVEVEARWVPKMKLRAIESECKGRRWKEEVSWKVEGRDRDQNRKRLWEA